MTVSYILAPNGRWSARTATGLPAAGAYLSTYQNMTQDFKDTYADPAGLVVNDNPIQLDSAGQANIYWADDEYYTIVLRDPDSGQVIYSQDNYPAVGGGGGGGDIIINQSDPNVVRNAQFSRWKESSHTDMGEPIVPGYSPVFTSLGTDEKICDDWYFSRNNTNSTVEISQGTFTIGQTDVPFNPIYYLHYNCSNTGAGGETFKRIHQRYHSVYTFSDSTISFGFWARSATESEVTVSIGQNFGSGGSPSGPVITEILTAELTADWQQFTATINLPSVVDKIIGTNKDDRISLIFDLPLNTLATVDMANIQLHESPTLPVFPYLTIDDQFHRLDSIVLYNTFYTGDFKFSIRSDAGDGWVVCNDGTIGSAFSGATRTGVDTLPLYCLIWTDISATYTPIYTSGGVLATRGANAMADFNAGKRLSLTKQLGRVLAGQDTGTSAGQYLGETTHQLTVPELPTITLNYIRTDVVSSGSPGTGATSSNLHLVQSTQATSSIGNNVAHNNMQPTTYMWCHIKL